MQPVGGIFADVPSTPPPIPNLQAELQRLQDLVKTKDEEIAALKQVLHFCTKP